MNIVTDDITVMWFRTQLFWKTIDCHWIIGPDVPKALSSFETSGTNYPVTRFISLKN